LRSIADVAKKETRREDEQRSDEEKDGINGEMCQLDGIKTGK